MMWLLIFIFWGCGSRTTKESSTGAQSLKKSGKGQFREFKSIVDRFYESNGWGGSGPDWTHFDRAARFSQTPIASTQLLGRDGVSLTRLFEDAVGVVRALLDKWLEQQAQGRLIPNFSQSLIYLMAASRLIDYGSDSSRLSDLSQRDKDRLIRDGLRILARIRIGENPLVILTFKNEVAACKQRYEISPVVGKEDALTDPSVCNQHAINEMEAIAIMEAAEHRLPPNIQIRLNQVLPNVNRLLRSATSLGRLDVDEFPRPVVSVYPDLVKAFDLSVQLEQQFLNPPAISMKERDDRAIDKLNQIEELLVDLEDNVENQHKKEAIARYDARNSDGE